MYFLQNARLREIKQISNVTLKNLHIFLSVFFSTPMKWFH